MTYSLQHAGSLSVSICTCNTPCSSGAPVARGVAAGTLRAAACAGLAVHMTGGTHRYISVCGTFDW